MKAILIIIGVSLLILPACDHGLDPEGEAIAPGIEGTVMLSEDWEPDSEVRELYVVVFQTIPQDSDDAINQFFQGKIKFEELTPPFQNEYSYSFNLDPGAYELVACVGIKGENFLDFSNWVLCGIYTETNNPLEPTSITITDDSRISGIDIQASVIYTIPLDF